MRLDRSCLAPVLALMALSGMAGTAPARPRCALITPRPYHLIVSNNQFDPGELELAATYGLIASAVFPTEMMPIRKINPKVIGLFLWTAGGIWEHPYDTGYRMPAWQLPDTAWGIIYRLQNAYEQNLSRGVDWAYRDINGKPILYWNERTLNWTSTCPRGVWGQTRGLTAAQYTAKAMLECAANPTFRAAYDGYWLDTYPGGWRDPKVFGSLDLNHDGRPDPMPLAEEAAQMDTLLGALRAGLQPAQLIILGQDQLHTPNARRVNGWKLENWLWQPGCSHRWIDWWNGERKTTGYYKARQVLRRYPASPDLDRYQGWNMSVIEAQRPPGQSAPAFEKYARFALATALLGDGWFACDTPGTDLPARIPEMDSWKVDQPLGDVFSVPNPKVKGASLICRAYKWEKTGETVTVWADTVAQEGGLTHGRMR